MKIYTFYEFNEFSNFIDNGSTDFSSVGIYDVFFFSVHHLVGDDEAGG